MAQKKRDLGSRPPENPAKLKRWAFRRLATAQERAFVKANRDGAIEHRSLTVSREIVRLLHVEEPTAEDIRVMLAAKALGLMQSMRRDERREFLKDSSGRVHGIMQKHQMESLFSEETLGDDQNAAVDVASKILGFIILAEELFDDYHYLAHLDFVDKKDTDYRGLYAEPIVNEELSRFVILARIVDMAIEPQKKIDYLNMGGTELSDKKLMEFFRTMNAVYYPLADLIGLGTTMAVQIRKNATDLLESLLSRKDENHEDVRLYRECKVTHHVLEPSAKKIAKELVIDGKLRKMLDDISKRLGLDMELASHTSNAEEQYRIKGPSGMFWKCKRKACVIDELQDFLGMTVVVDGSIGDAREVADWIVIALRHMQIKKADIKDKERESGYWVPHVVFKVRKNGLDVPVEIQVRPRKTHLESKTGKYAHGLKVGRSFVDGALVKALEPAFMGMEGIFDTQRLTRKDLDIKPSNTRKYGVQVFDKTAKPSDASYTLTVDANKGEVVGGLIALSTGLEKSVVVTTRDGQSELTLFNESPGDIFVMIKKGKGVDQNTCDLLLKGKVVTPEAIEAITEYRKNAPRKSRWGRKRKK
jgi:hypothetical protein